MAGTWVYKYNEDTIVVRNKRATELLVNDELKDSKTGIHLKVELNTTLKDGSTVRAIVIGTLEVECLLLINNVLQTPIKKD